MEAAPPATVVEALTPALLEQYLDFFDTRAFTDNPRWAGCYCYYPLHDPKQKEWGDRTGTENREAVSACILAGQAQGYLARRGGEVVGWCAAGPKHLYPMLRTEGGRDGGATGVIFCFIVAPDHRRQGVASTLLEAACHGLQAQGLTTVEARPQRENASQAANERGPLSMYLQAGFSVTDEYPDGSVRVRKQLA